MEGDKIFVRSSYVHVFKLGSAFPPFRFDHQDAAWTQDFTGTETALEDHAPEVPCAYLVSMRECLEHMRPL